MNLKVQWMNRGDKVNEPGLAFCFESSQDLFKGILAGLVTYWLKAGDNLPAPNNLVITGFGEIDLPGPTFAQWSKGEPENGTHRYVYPIFNDPALPFRAGLTLHTKKGTWSSLPHEFEREEILLPRPMPFYEKFAYITETPGGWGIQTRIGHLFMPGDIFSNEPDSDNSMMLVNDTVTIRDRDILDIPLGSHPVTAGPEVRLGYFWIYWGNLEGREKFTKDKAL